MVRATGEGYVKLAVQNFSLWQCINHDSAVNSINIAKKGACFLSKIFWIIYKPFTKDISFVTFSRFKIVCQSR